MVVVTNDFCPSTIDEHIIRLMYGRTPRCLCLRSELPTIINSTPSQLVPYFNRFRCCFVLLKGFNLFRYFDEFNFVNINKILYLWYYEPTGTSDKAKDGWLLSLGEKGAERGDVWLATVVCQEERSLCGFRGNHFFLLRSFLSFY